MGEGAMCPSTIHLPSDEPTDEPWPALPATIPGVYDGSRINGRAPSRMTYCIRCAWALHMARVFTPDDPADLLPAPAPTEPTERTAP